MAEAQQESGAEHIAAALKLAAVVDGVAADTPLLPLGRVGIIGAGTMGGGIAMNFANAGIPVTIVETRQAALDRGLAVIRRNYERSASRGRFPMDEVDVRMARITPTLDMAQLADCDLIIEAVFEDMALKKQIFTRLDAIAKPGAILASNTSGLDVNEIAAVTARPESVIGLHFFSPANVMKLIEVVRGAKTAPVVIATSLDMARRIGKVAVVVGVCPGFVGNRMLYPRMFQSAELLKRGAEPWQVDRVIKAFGFKMGPFEAGDLAGLDIGWVEGEGDPLRDALCRRNRRGQKTGAGYYDYDADRRPTPSEEVSRLIREAYGPATGATPPDDREILERSLFPMVNEGARILEEGIAQRPSDIDLVWIYGYNWPQETGGPMRWADSVGLPRILSRMEELGRESPMYAPAQLLRRLAAEGKGFASLQ